MTTQAANKCSAIINGRFFRASELDVWHEYAQEEFGAPSDVTTFGTITASGIGAVVRLRAPITLDFTLSDLSYISTNGFVKNASNDILVVRIVTDRTSDRPHTIEEIANAADEWELRPWQDVLRSDPVRFLVYADWLEEQGRDSQLLREFVQFHMDA